MGHLISFQNFNKYGFLLFKAATLISLYFILSFNNNLNCAIRYVSKTGSSTEPYTSWQTAADSIQKCINASSFGDTIYVDDGVYKEIVNMKNGISLIGSGFENCIIDGRTLGIPAAGGYLVNAKDSCLISGFNLIVNEHNSPASTQNYDGHAILVWTGDYAGQYSTTIKNNLISQAFFGIIADRIYVDIIDNIFTNCDYPIRIDHNFAPGRYNIVNNIINDVYDIAIYSGAGSISDIRNNVIYLVDRTAGGLDVYGTSMNFSNNIMITDTVSHFAVSSYTTPSTYVNNTFIGYFQEAAFFNYPNDTIKNNLLLRGEYGIRNAFNNYDTEIKYNCLWDFQIYSGTDPLDSINIIAYPMFADEENDDYHLQMYSPCIDAGDPNILDVDGSRSDIGYYGGPGGESYTYQDLAPRPPVNMNAEVDSNTVTLTWNRNHETDFKEYKIYKYTSQGFTISPQKLVGTTSDTTITDEINSKKNVYYKGISVDAQGNESSPGEEVVIVIVGVDQPKIEEKDFRLYQNYPNPFNPSTIMSYRLKSSGYVRLVVYDVKGELITELVNEYQSEGYYEKLFDAKAMNLSSGVYLFRIEVKNENNIPVFTDMRKSILLK